MNNPQYTDSARYDIALRIVDDNTVELTGKLSGETVRITFSPGENNLGESGKRVYSSSDPAHAPFTHDDPPHACPDPFEPAWYWDFLGANARKLPGAPKIPAPRPRLRNGLFAQKGSQ